MDEVVDRVHRAVDQVERLAYRSSDSNAHISINAGGVGIWIAVTCCLVMLAVTVVGGVWMAREFGRIDIVLSERKEEADRMQTYLSAIYARAPHLKPDERKDKTDAQR